MGLLNNKGTVSVKAPAPVVKAPAPTPVTPQVKQPAPVEKSPAPTPVSPSTKNPGPSSDVKDTSPSYSAPESTYSEPVVITYSVTKTNYFNGVNVDEIYSACMDILQKLRTFGLIYSLQGIWEAATANKLQKELNKMHVYLEYLCATLQGYTNLLEQARNIKSLQSQVDSYCTDLTSYENYVAATNLISQINSLMGNINPSLSAMQTQSVLPASINESFSSTVASTYRFCYNAVLGVANQAKSDRASIVSHYQSFCNLQSSVAGDSYINSGWNIVVQLFDKFIKKSDLIANWWTNYFANVRTIEQRLPDGDFTVSEVTVDTYGRDHEGFAIPSIDAYRTANQGESLNFNIPGRSSSTGGSSGTNNRSNTNNNGLLGRVLGNNKDTLGYKAPLSNDSGYKQPSPGSGYKSPLDTPNTSGYKSPYTPGDKAPFTDGSTSSHPYKVPTTPNYTVGPNSSTSYLNRKNPTIPNYTVGPNPSSSYLNRKNPTIPNYTVGPNPSTSYMNQKNPSGPVGPNYTVGPNASTTYSVNNSEMLNQDNLAHSDDRDAFDQNVRQGYEQRSNPVYCILHDTDQTEITREQFNQYNREYNTFMTSLRSNYPNIHALVESGDLAGQQLTDWAAGKVNELNALLQEQQNIVSTETAAAQSLQDNHLFSLTSDWQTDANAHLAAASRAEATANHYASLITTLSNVIDHGREMMMTSSPGAYTVLGNGSN